MLVYFPARSPVSDTIIDVVRVTDDALRGRHILPGDLIEIIAAGSVQPGDLLADRGQCVLQFLSPQRCASSLPIIGRASRLIRLFS